MIQQSCKLLMFNNHKHSLIIFTQNLNIMLKYANDIYLIIGEVIRDLISEKLERMPTWAARNNLRLNQAESCEAVIRQSAKVNLPPPLLAVQHMSSMKILEVTIHEDLRTSSHVDEI